MRKLVRFVRHASLEVRGFWREYNGLGSFRELLSAGAEALFLKKGEKTRKLCDVAVTLFPEVPASLDITGEKEVAGGPPNVELCELRVRMARDFDELRKHHG